MQRSSPFSHSIAMFAAITAAMSGSNSAEAQMKIAALGQYESRGKGEGSFNRRARGAGMASIRAATKTRNVKRHRKACRG